MALGVKARGDIEKKIDRNRRQREKARKTLDEHGEQPTERNVLRYILWEQQDNHCPYCGKTLALEQAVDGNVTNLEHILPRTLTRVGRQRNHLVLAHRSCNDAKRDRTPYEAFGHDADLWAKVTFCASVLESNKQFAKARLLMLQDYEHEVLDDESIAEFSARQYAETSWIGKLTAKWMRDISPRVSVSRGTMTAHLRRIWKLETVIAQARFDASLPVLDTDGERITLDDFSRFKAFWEGHSGSSHPRTDRKIDKRIDHRHHLIDALVIAQTSVSLYQRMARHYKDLAERRAQGEPVRIKLEAEPPIRDLRGKALSLVHAAAIHHKADRLGGGPLFEQFAYGTSQVEDDPGRLHLHRRRKLSEIPKKGDGPTKVRLQLEFIASREVRDLVLGAFDARVVQGQSAFDALQSPIIHPLYGTVIKAVKCICGLAESAAIVGHRSRTGDHRKALIEDGWAYLDVRIENGTKVETTLVSPRMADRSRGIPVPENTVRLFKGDSVIDVSSGKQYVIRQIKAQAGGLLVMTPIVDAREVRDMSASEGLKKVSGKGLHRIKHLHHGG